MNSQQELLAALSGFSSKSMDKIGFFPFLGIMGISLLVSLFIALLYVRFYRSRSTGSQIYRVFPLLGISITAIFIAIQFSLPLSLGLLGALSIVRFRTPIKEPEEIGFIMLVVAASLCCATFNILFLSIILTVAVMALLAMHYGRRILDYRLNDGMLIISLPTKIFRKEGEKIMQSIENSVVNGRLDSIAEKETETVLSYNFINQKENFIPALNDSLKSLHVDSQVNVFYNKHELS
jgi:hypothetical protein